MRVLFTCGGTAGHINPALALARLFQERQRDCAVLFVGADGGMERELVTKEGFQIRTVTITNFQRSLHLRHIRHNLRTVRNLGLSRRQAEAILDEFRPDLVVGTGGYASYPVVHAAARRHIPTAIHESNAVPGLTTKLLSKVVDLVMVGFEGAAEHYHHPEKVVVTGTPVRGDFFRYTRREAREKLGIHDERPLLLSYWGSLGATVMNDYMARFIALECGAGTPFHHIHGAGGSYRRMLQKLSESGADLEGHPEIRVQEYIYDMPTVMAAADLVLCRSGASTISELIAIAKPAVLVPSPNVTADHQTKNAAILARAGGAVLLGEGECSAEKLYALAEELLLDEKRRREMSHALAQVSQGDASERIYEALMGLLR